MTNFTTVYLDKQRGDQFTMNEHLPTSRLSTVVSATPITCNNCGHPALLAEFIITLSNYRRCSLVLRVCLDDEHGCKLVELDNYQWDETWDELRETLRGILNPHEKLP